MTEPTLHAHRGASHAAPENTMLAFERAVVEGADAIELDVRLSRDRVPFVFHDAELSRMTGAPGKVADTPADHLATLSARGEPIPRLAELLAFTERHRVPLNIELKPTARPRELVDACAPLLTALAQLAPLLVSSFDPRALALLHQRLPALALALIFEDPRALTALAHLPPVDLHPRSDLVDPSTLPTLLPAAHPHRTLRAWTVDDPAEAHRLRALPHPHAPTRPAVAALITNRPGPLRAELRAPHAVATSLGPTAS